MLYITLLNIHSLIRWVALFALGLSLACTIVALLRRHGFTKFHVALRKLTVGAVHLQLLLGIALYLQSPLIRTGHANIGASMKVRELRFFLIEHPIMMLLAGVVITLGARHSKRGGDANTRHRRWLAAIAWATAIVLITIPWPFTPIAPARPLWRPFNQPMADTFRIQTEAS
jgi:hypothetical protein